MNICKTGGLIGVYHVFQTVLRPYRDFYCFFDAESKTFLSNSNENDDENYSLDSDEILWLFDW